MSTNWEYHRNHITPHPVPVRYVWDFSDPPGPTLQDLPECISDAAYHPELGWLHYCRFAEGDLPSGWYLEGKPIYHCGSIEWVTELIDFMAKTGQLERI